MRWSIVLAILATAGCDRVFGVEGVPHSVDASPRDGLEVDTSSVPDGSAGAYSDVVLADHPLAFYRLDENTGPIASDTVGRVDGTYVGDVFYAQTPAVVAESGASVQLGLADTANSGILFGDDFKFDGTAAFTLELWLYPIASSPHTFGNVISKWLQPPASAGYIIYTENVSKLIFARDSGAHAGDRGSLSTTISTENWSHVVAAYNGTDMMLFVNGQAVGSSQSLQLIPSMTTRFVIGSANGDATTNPYRGQIDNVAIYDHALSAAQVHAHYEAAGVSD